MSCLVYSVDSIEIDQRYKLKMFKAIILTFSLTLACASAQGPLIRGIERGIERAVQREVARENIARENLYNQGIGRQYPIGSGIGGGLNNGIGGLNNGYGGLNNGIGSYPNGAGLGGLNGGFGNGVGGLNSGIGSGGLGGLNSGIGSVGTYPVGGLNGFQPVAVVPVVPIGASTGFGGAGFGNGFRG